MRQVPLVSLLLFLVSTSQAHGQLASAELHAHATDFIATRALLPMPAGDTLLTWNGDRLVLFHTVRRDSSGVHSGLLRADRMLGLADVRWTNGSPTSFGVQWRTPKATGVDSMIMQGTVRPDGIHISRIARRDTTLATPTGLWAVADYGMEELLLPVFDAVPPTPIRLLVLRPYALKWDTLSVSADPPHQGWRVGRWTDASGERWTATIGQGAHLFWLRRSDHPDDEKLPLEGTSLRQMFDRLRPSIESASRPSRPNER